MLSTFLEEYIGSLESDQAFFSLQIASGGVSAATGCDLPRVRVNGKLMLESEREYRDALFER